MGIRYAKEIPQDKNNQPYNTTPAVPSQQSQSGVPVASSVITLTDNTTVLDVTVTGATTGTAAVIGKWGSASVTTANFDWVVQAGQYRTFVVPQSTAGTTSIVGINKQMGLYNTVAVKTVNATAASILTVEY